MGHCSYKVIQYLDLKVCTKKRIVKVHPDDSRLLTCASGVSLSLWWYFGRSTSGLWQSRPRSLPFAAGLERIRRRYLVCFSPALDPFAHRLTPVCPCGSRALTISLLVLLLDRAARAASDLPLLRSRCLPRRLSLISGLNPFKRRDLSNVGHQTMQEEAHPRSRQVDHTVVST